VSDKPTRRELAAQLATLTEEIAVLRQAITDLQARPCQPAGSWWQLGTGVAAPPPWTGQIYIGDVPPYGGYTADHCNVTPGVRA